MASAKKKQMQTSWWFKVVCWIFFMISFSLCWTITINEIIIIIIIIFIYNDANVRLQKLTKKNQDESHHSEVRKCVVVVMVLRIKILFHCIHCHPNHQNLCICLSSNQIVDWFEWQKVKFDFDFVFFISPIWWWLMIKSIEMKILFQFKIQNYRSFVLINDDY